MPPMAGQLKWAQGLKDKMTHSVKGFKELNHPICFKDGAKNVFIKYKDLMSLLTTFEDDVFMKWNQSITKKINLSLSKSLLYRDIKKGVLRVNFGKDLGAMLREVCMYHDFIIYIYIHSNLDIMNFDIVNFVIQ